jgi:hypothetical protein
VRPTARLTELNRYGAFETWQSCFATGKAPPSDLDLLGLEPPFEVCDREDDMRAAYAFFAATLGGSVAS